MTQLGFHYSGGFPMLRSLTQLPKYKPLAQTDKTVACTKPTAAPIAEDSKAPIISAEVNQAIGTLLAFWSGTVGDQLLTPGQNSHVSSTLLLQQCKNII